MQTIGYKENYSKKIVSAALRDAYMDFTLRCQAKRLSEHTLSYYKYTAGRFVTWLEGEGITGPNEVKAHHVRQFLAERSKSTDSDWTYSGYIRAIKTLIRFWCEEGYCEYFPIATPPKVKTRQPVPSLDDVRRLLAACHCDRDKAIVLFAADTGARRAEIVQLNWGDIDFDTGLVRIVRGKGKKPRSTVCSPKTRRALIKYRRGLEDSTADAPLFQTRDGTRFTNDGFCQVFYRLGKNAGVHITPHQFRRFFVIESLRTGIDVLHLQNLLGHSDLSMVQHYAQMVDDDLIQAHRQHSPVDKL